jgi:hypothetical protein
VEEHGELFTGDAGRAGSWGYRELEQFTLGKEEYLIRRCLIPDGIAAFKQNLGFPVRLRSM